LKPRHLETVAFMDAIIASGYVFAGDFVVKTVTVAEAEMEVVAWR